MTEYAGRIVLGADSDGVRASIQEGESAKIIGTFYDGDTVIVKASLLTVLASLFLESTGASINSRNAQDILDANGGMITTPGVLTVKLQPADNIIVGAPAIDVHEPHILRILWTWNDGSDDLTGIQDIRLYVQQLRAVT